MKLLPAQRKKLAERLNTLEQTYQSLFDTKKGARNEYAALDGFNDLETVELANKINDVNNEIRELRTLLATCEVTLPSKENIIGIGSNFVATIDFMGLKETDTYTLTESSTQVAGKNIVTTSSPMGKAVYGKSENDLFSYMVNDTVFNGQVNKINVIENAKTIVK